jgi:hypothetical protein
MPFVPVANAVGVEMRMTLDNQKIENTLYFFNPTGPDATNMTLLASELEGWWTNECAPLLPLDVALREIVITDLTTATSFQVTSALAAPVFGTVGSPALPNNVSMAVSFRTALRGRSFRGRNYIAALTEGSVVNNTVQPTQVADWIAAYAQLLTDPGIAAAGYTWCVVTRFSGVDANGDPIPRVAGGAQPVTAVVVTDTTVDSMRRRLPGRGQ